MIQKIYEFINNFQTMLETFKEFWIDYCLPILNISKDKIIELIKASQCDTRTNIYIGITGILVAIVIFIAEMVSNDKVEIYKDLMLKRTKIKNIVGMMIVTMISIWIGEIIDTNVSASCIVRAFGYLMLRKCGFLILFHALDTND